MHRISAALACFALIPAGRAAPTIEFLPAGYLVSDANWDGSVLVGNVVGDFSYETFRWTAATGVQRLGRATVPVLGTGAGTPDVSFDGTRVSATIITADNTAATQGVWTLGSGWIETMPPSPADGVLLDNSYGSAWGLSGDGSTLTGFYWGTGPGSAKPCTWSASTGVVALERTPGRSARVNAADFDGDVVVGWEERSDGAWQPTVWRNGVKSRLTESEGFAEAYGVNADGTIIVGDWWDPSEAKVVMTVWTWNGAAYTRQSFGALPGTSPNFGGSWLSAVSADGTVAVGGNRYSQSPGGPMDGLVWTAQSGLMRDTDFLASLGLSVPANSDIRTFDAVSGDGRVIVGTLLRGAELQSFVIRLGSCPGDFNGDGSVDFGDLNLLLGNYNTSGPGLAGDFDGDGDVDFADLNALLAVFNTPCA
ncbi:MAG: hypothetical protein IBJ10_06130 [Phycisphaerales bacterium]|nr:hypothetical protein [Phycisphaerales bacterium]